MMVLTMALHRLLWMLCPQAAFIHVLGDLVQSVGVVIASIIIWYASLCPVCHSPLDSPYLPLLQGGAQGTHRRPHLHIHLLNSGAVDYR